jgi:tripartite-type tricarboxylate transporter receptor subunit TctC
VTQFNTLLMNYTSHAINPWLMQNLPYDSDKSCAPVAFLGKVPVLPAVPSDGHRNVDELIGDARRNPGKLSYGSSATGGASHLGGELFSQLTGGKLVLVPYKGGAAAAMDLGAGRIDMLLDSQLALKGMQQAGKIRFLGVASERESVVFPDLAPAGTPAAVIEQLNAGINRALGDPEIRRQLIERGFEPEAMSATQWGAFLSGETARWGALIQKAGLKSQ